MSKITEKFLYKILIFVLYAARRGMEEEATMMVPAPADQRPRERAAAAAEEEEKKRALAVWRAVRGCMSLSLRLGDVLAVLRATTRACAITTTATAAAAAADDQLVLVQQQKQKEEEELLEEVWWWLFVSQGDNACLAFLLLGDDDAGTVARAHKEEEDDRREEVFFELAPAFLDRLLYERVAWRDLRSKLQARLATESVLVWQRVKQACSSYGGARRQDGHSSTHNDYRQAELVRILLHCLTGGGVRRWEETGLFEQVVLRHTNVAVVLGISPTPAPAHTRALLAIEACSTLTAVTRSPRSHVPMGTMRRGHRLHLEQRKRPPPVAQAVPPSRRASERGRGQWRASGQRARLQGVVPCLLKCAAAAAR
jgi:hypothetical protein